MNKNYKFMMKKVYCCSHDCAICSFKSQKERKEYMEELNVSRWRIWEEIHLVSPERYVKGIYKKQNDS